MSGVGLLLSRLRIREAGPRLFKLHVVAARPGARSILPQTNALKLACARSVTTKSTKTTSSGRASAAKKAPAKKAPVKKAAAKKTDTKKKKAPAKKAAAKRAAPKKKTTAKKPVKRKAAKKELTKAEKEEKRQRRLAKARKERLTTKKEEMKALILDPPTAKPDLSISGYNVFLAEIMKGKKPDFKNMHIEANWKEVPTSDKQKYTDLAHKKQEATKGAYEAFIERYTPKQIREANLARKFLQKAEPHRKYPQLIDHRLPKKPLASYIVFFSDFAKDPQYKSLSIAERAKAAGAKWKSLSEAEKRPYEMVAESQKQKYAEELAALG